MDLKRVEDWPERLVRFVEARQAMPFAWGRHDCALFAADWVAECTGEDIARRFRGRYKTARGAAGALRRYGAGTLVDTVTAALGPPMTWSPWAQRGDVVAVMLDERGDPDDPMGWALGICLGAHIACITPEAGLQQMPLGRADKAWRV